MKKRINLLAGLLIGITTIFTACSNDNIVTEKENSETTKEQNLTSFIAQNPRTRTSMDENGDWYWEEGDRIFVKDDNGNWRRSANAVDAAQSPFAPNCTGLLGVFCKIEASTSILLPLE